MCLLGGEQSLALEAMCFHLGTLCGFVARENISQELTANFLLRLSRHQGGKVCARLALVSLGGAEQ